MKTIWHRMLLLTLAASLVACGGDSGGELVIDGGNTITANFDVDTPCL